MKHKNPLWLHSELLKLVFTLALEHEHPDGSPVHYAFPSRVKDDFLYSSSNIVSEEELDENPDLETVCHPLWHLKFSLPLATIFDCRKLPYNFVLDTGESFFEEPPEIRGPVRVPFSCCYWEFENMFSVLTETAGFVKGEDGKEIPVFAQPVMFNILQSRYTGLSWLSGGSFLNDAEHPIISNETGGDITGLNREGGLLVLGMLNLMRDKLVSEEFAADPKPWVNRKRLEAGKYPLSGNRTTITLNVGAVRRLIASAPVVTTHESPTLHWRRGHWRVLHRFSEFEKRTWIRRCLVGDPSKGFVGHRDYSVIHQLPMLKAT